jgi:hypothetical protein
MASAPARQMPGVVERDLRGPAATARQQCVIDPVLHSRPMLHSFFFTYFWFSHRAGGGEASA